jgi:hypothetical protein
MEMPISNTHVSYGKATLFDLEAGMPVYGPARAKMGIVTEGRGLRIDPPWPRSTAWG